jgi:ketosteroid isomerase-like protein
MHELTQRFVAALDELHSNRTVTSLVNLFADDATLARVGVPREERGRDGARNFWQQYRDVFDSVDADFKHAVTGDEIACLEWTSRETLNDGSEFAYDGVSVLEAHGDTIDAFRTYYDTAAFLSEEGSKKSASRVHIPASSA